MGTRMKAQLVFDALTMAVWQRKPKTGLIVHADRVSQYASLQFRRLLSANGFVIANHMVLFTSLFSYCTGKLGFAVASGLGDGYTARGAGIVC